MTPRISVESLRTSKLTRALQAALFASLVVPVAAPVYAADESAEDDQRIVVTGSRIKRVDAEGPSPVLTITSEDMDRQGYATFQDVMDSLVQNTGGSTDLSFTFGFTPAASAVDLRGFGSGRSLVLIDGRRMPVYPIGLSGTNNFVDLSSIPTALIERVEVLTDGASAIYGSDAISGVINIITKKDVQGVNLSVRYGDTSDGGGQSQRIQMLAGASLDRTSVNFTLEHNYRDVIWSRDRDYAASDVANPRGAYSIGGSSFLGLTTATIVQDPDCGTPNDALGGLGVPDQTIPIFTANDTWCGFNRTAYRQLMPEDERNSAFMRIDHELTSDLNVFGRFGFSQAETNTQLEPNFYGGSFFTGQAANPIVPNDGAILPAGHPNNPLGEAGIFVRRLVEFGPRTSEIETNGLNGLVGVEGYIGSSWDWSAAIGYNKIEVDSKRPNIILSALHAAVDDGLDLFEPIPQSVVNQLSYLSSRSADSANTTFDFQLSGELPWELAGGAIGFAAVVDYERQWFSDESDPITTAGDSFDGASAGGGERDHTGFGVEFAFPILDNLELSVAARRDKYDDDSDVGSATSPRIAVAYRPTETVLLRASWGESFRAPDLSRLFGATTRGFQTVNDPVTGLQVQSVSIFTGSNVNLAEEEGENKNIGVVWNATDDLSFTLDVYEIELENIVAAPTPQFILNSCGANQDGNLCNLITRDAQGTLQGGFITSTAQNLSFQSIRGADFTTNYSWDSDFGAWKSTLELAYVDELRTQFSEGQPVTENIGFAALPEMRINFTQDWTMGDWGATFRAQWVDEMPGVNCTPPTGASTCSSDTFIDDYLIMNATVRYDVGEWGQIMLGVNNLANEDPADDPTNNNWPWFFNNGGYSNPIGREYYVQYSVTF